MNGDGEPNAKPSKRPRLSDVSILIASLKKKKNKKEKKEKERKDPFDSKPTRSTDPLKSEDQKPELDRSKELNIKKKKKRRRKRSRKDNAAATGVVNEPSRLQRRIRYLLIKMKLEQNLIDAYSCEGWKGQSREKIKPEKELERAQDQILKCKLAIRDTIRQLDLLSAVGPIEASVIAPDGTVSHEHIFCAKCKSNKVSPDDDIVLCDGTCNCAFHQKCLDPPLETKNIPPGDEGWFCKLCECRMDIIEAINAHLGVHFPIDSKWEDIFKEATTLPDGRSILFNPEEEWPSDDSADDDYDPERRCNVSGAGTNDDVTDYSTSCSTSLGWSSDGGLFLETEGVDFGECSVYSGLPLEETSDVEILSGCRHRSTVDYRKLYDEMFGKDSTANELASEDEDWGPRKRRQRREKESDAATTLMTLHGSEENCQQVEPVDTKKLPRDLESRRTVSRIPPYAIEKLRLAFSENELPSRTVKENLSKELGIEPGKVNKWFKNARYLALKARKTESHKLQASSHEASREIVSDLPETRISTLNNFKKVRRMKLKSNKRKQRRASLESPPESNEACGDNVNNDVRLNKLLNPKSCRQTASSQLAEAEIERLCTAKGRLERLRHKLLGLPRKKSRKSKHMNLPGGGTIIYIPVVQLKEKVHLHSN